MKLFSKYLFALAVFVYLLNNIGIPVYYHYCEGELESVNAVFKASTCCGEEEEEEEESGCCQNETKILAQKSENPFQTFSPKFAPTEVTIFSQPLSEPAAFANLSLLPNPAHYTYSRPPCQGRDILASISVLII